MHIWILTQFYPPEIGAASVRLSRLAKLLAADGHQVTVLTGMPNYPEGVIPAPYRGHLLWNELRDGVDIRRVWVYASPSKGTRARLLNQGTFMLLSALRGTFLRRPDVILVESHPLFVCLSAGWLRAIKRVPIVLNVSDLWPESAVATGALRADSAMVRIAAHVEAWAYRSAAHIIGMTEGVVSGILAVHPDRARVSLIQNAVDLATFRPATPDERRAARQQLGLADGFVITHVGNMSLTYDFDIMLDAAQALPDATFVFVGGGSRAVYLETQTQARGLTNVVFKGVLPHNQMPGVWAASDVCLVALGDHSVAGGTRPAKLLEALASGTPVVAAIRGEGAALLEQHEAGIVVPIGSADALTAALVALRDDPARRAQLAANGRAYAETHLSPTHVKQAYLDILLQVSR